jgi:lipopolysaccharide assembly outer membrane protein LptD (OstA)
VTVRFNTGYDFKETQFSEGLLEARWSTETGHNLGFSYRYLRDIPRFFESFLGDENRFDEFEEGFQSINQIALRGRLAVTRNWALSYGLRYSFENNIVLTNRAGVEYISKCRCWAVLAQVGEDRAGGVDFNFRFILIGLGDDDVRPFAGSRGRTGRDPYGAVRF